MNQKMSKLNKLQLIGSTILIVAAIIIGLYLEGRAGQAINIGTSPFVGVADLTQEELLIFTSLPAVHRQVHVRTALSPFGTQFAPDDFLFTVKPRDANTYEYNITLYDVSRIENRRAGGNLLLFEEGILDINGDSSDLYLRNAADQLSLDDIPDLTVSLRNGQITVRNRHFLSADAFVVTLYNNNSARPNREIFSQVIRLNSTKQLELLVNITGIAKPDVTFSIIPSQYNVNITSAEWALTLGDRVPPFYPNTTINVSWDTPVNKVAAILNISLKVQNKVSNKYYRLAVGNLTYNLSENNLPWVNVTFNNPDYVRTNANAAALQVTFKATTQLQPFAAPCELAQGSLTTLLGTANVDRVYRFDPSLQRAEQAVSSAPSGSFTQLEPFKGYFVKLINPTRTKVVLNCQVKTLQSAVRGLPPSFTGTPINLPQISAGWNLFALPGVLPQPLTNVVNPNDDFQIYECGQNEQCSRKAKDHPLDPGKVYWVYSRNSFRGSSVFS